MGLTEAQRAHLHGEGWLRLEQVLAPAQVREMNAAWDRWQEGVSPEKVGGNWGPEQLDAEPAFQPCLRHRARGGGWWARRRTDRSVRW